MEKNQRVRCKKPFENWLRVSGSKLNVSVLDFKKMALLFYILKQVLIFNHLFRENVYDLGMKKLNDQRQKIAATRCSTSYITPGVED